MTTPEPSAPNRPAWALTGASLDLVKLLAMVLMILDHTNESIFGDAYTWMHLLGRGAFPLFAYAMACHLVKQPRLDSYLKRLILFAIISQPVFELASHDNTGNVLFTLACGAIAGAWVVGEAAWRRNVLFTLALSSFFFSDIMDFGFAGVALPAAIACVLRGDRFVWPWLFVMTVMLNADFNDFFEIKEGVLAFTSIAQDDLLPAFCALGIPMFVIWVCKFREGARFLHRYALYAFYPGHLLLLSIVRLSREPFPTSLFF